VRYIQRVNNSPLTLAYSSNAATGVKLCEEYAQPETLKHGKWGKLAIEMWFVWGQTYCCVPSDNSSNVSLEGGGDEGPADVGYISKRVCRCGMYK